MNEFLKQLDALCANNPNTVTMLANASALLNEHLDDINWVGFYLYQNNELELGPFQGKVACTRIPVGKGVCGTAFEKDEVQNVKDVHKFPGHIACDSNTNSEIVVPLKYEDKLFGVLDIDSISFGRFSDEDEKELIETANIIAKYLKK